MKISAVTNYLESLAPLSSQEGYDNSGMIVGDKEKELTKALISLDCTEEIIEEAIQNGCNLIIAHHPIVFKGLKSFTGKNYVERTVISAIKNDIAIYAIHTNLDNYRGGVNKKISDKLGIKNPKVLSPSKDTLSKISVFCPVANTNDVKNAMFQAGAGNIGEYSHCSFSAGGEGTFMASENANPYVGNKNEVHKEEEVKIEVIASNHKLSKILNALLEAHPYEEVAYDIYPLANINKYEGAGMYGDLESPINTEDFLQNLKKSFNCGVIRHTAILKDSISRVAWCGGSGSFLLSNAKRVNADIYITGDFKYHEFFDAENQILIADIGHYESEQFTSELIAELCAENFTNFAAYLSKTNTNPIKYL
ncbi:MAG: Nif3-like dinuclear metal center hexameric protein [Crocinitomicaceae bacterium]|nr:Nif3-like dinuclear metal center hexameric protein [Crocinitomicaceae bacterium]